MPRRMGGVLWGPRHGSAVILILSSPKILVHPVIETVLPMLIHPVPVLGCLRVPGLVLLVVPLALCAADGRESQ